MAIIVDRDTKLVVQGLTGREGSFHGLRNRGYGTKSSRASRRARAARTSRGSRSSTRSRTPSARPARTRRWSSSRAVRRRRGLRGGRRGDRDRHLHHGAHPRARDAARLQLHPPARDHDDRAELPGRALAGQGERRDHPRGDLQRGQGRARLPLGHADLPDRPRAGQARARQLDDRRDRRRPGRRLVVHRRARAVRGRRRDRDRRARRRDRRRRGGEGGALHLRAMSKPVFAYIAGFSRPPGRRWGTPGRSSPARPAPHRRRRRRSRRRRPGRDDTHRSRRQWSPSSRAG